MRTSNAHAVFVRPILAPLLKSGAPTSDDYIREFGIRQRRLDFYGGSVLDPATGKPAPYAPVFTALPDRQGVEEAVRVNKPTGTASWAAPASLLLTRISATGGM